MMNIFHPGDPVLWWKNAGGGFVFPVLATVVRVTAKRVTITAEDPDEKGAGIVTRHLSPSDLQPQQHGPGTEFQGPAGPVTGKPRPK